MKHPISIAIAVFAAIQLHAQQIIYDSISHDGLNREFIIYLPASYTPGTEAPLVFNFHGYTSNAVEQLFYGDFRSIADTAGFIVVHPQGTPDIFGSPHWNVGWGASSVDDVGFTDALIDYLAANYSINEQRIYSTGMSNGGFFSYYLACNLSERIAAIASVTGSMGTGLINSCDPDHQMPALEIHGTADPTVPYEGNFLAAPIPDVVSFWAEFNETDQPPLVYELPDIDMTDSSTVEHHIYTGGNNGSRVEHYKVINGGHTWPGTIVDIGITNHDMNASLAIWNFFAQFDINGRISTVAAQDIRAGNITAYPNPTERYITVVHEAPGTAIFNIHTVSGLLLTEGSITGNTGIIDLGALPSGMYFLSVGNARLKIYKD